MKRWNVFPSQAWWPNPNTRQLDRVTGRISIQNTSLCTDVLATVFSIGISIHDGQLQGEEYRKPQEIITHYCSTIILGNISGITFHLTIFSPSVFSSISFFLKNYRFNQILWKANDHNWMWNYNPSLPLSTPDGRPGPTSFTEDLSWKCWVCLTGPYYYYYYNYYC